MPSFPRISRAPTWMTSVFWFIWQGCNVRVGWVIDWHQTKRPVMTSMNVLSPVCAVSSVTTRGALSTALAYRATVVWPTVRDAKSQVRLTRHCQYKTRKIKVALGLGTKPGIGCFEYNIAPRCKGHVPMSTGWRPTDYYRNIISYLGSSRKENRIGE